MLLFVCFLVVGIGTAIAVGQYRWQTATASWQHRLLPERPQAQRAAAKLVDLSQLEGLPAPVARYFRYVLPEAVPPVRSVRLTQEGAFRIGAADSQWLPLRATQVFTTAQPGFVWDAKIELFSLLSVRVRDAYIQGQGSMQGKLAGLMPVVAEQGKPELNAGALQRYLAEAVWFPTALLPSQGVQWHGLNDQSARATLKDGNNEVSLQFRFNETGEIVEAYTPERYREDAGNYQATPWRVRYQEYERRNGMRIPVAGEVEWLLPEGPLPYWRGRIVGILYDFGRGASF